LKQSELIARLILSTKRKKREFSILEIASDISFLKEMLGSLKEVSKVIGISTEMLNQFLSVYKLPQEVQTLVKERKIDRVAVVFLLSKFSEEDLQQLIPMVSDRKISSQDLKVLLPYRKQHSQEKIIDLIKNLSSSKNVKISVVNIPRKATNRSSQQIAEIIKAKVGDDNFLVVTEDENLYGIKIKKEGEKILRAIAKEEKISLSALITTLIN
jgi:hypothetical protein